MPARDEVSKWFGDLEACIKAHKNLAIYYYDCITALEGLGLPTFKRLATLK
jgi:hypothetical protein